MVEGKRKSSGFGSEFSQAIATAITFSFVYKGRCSFKGTLFPTIQVSSDGFEIFLYDSDTDVLLMNTYTWEPTNIVFLWALLHYGLLMTETTALQDFKDKDFKCGYKRLSDEFGGLTRLEGRAKFAVPITSVAHRKRNDTNIIPRCTGGKRKLFHEQSEH